MIQTPKPNFSQKKNKKHQNTIKKLFIHTQPRTHYNKNLGNQRQKKNMASLQNIYIKQKINQRLRTCAELHTYVRN